MGSVRAAFVFDGSIRDQVHRYKYRGEFARAQSLADIMFERIIDHEFVDHTSWDVVAHVPLHRRRRRERGFDQAEFLARRLAQRLGLPLQEGLERIRDTPSQVGQGEAERLTNVRDAFALVDEPLVGRSVLLIDDVITTGATLIAASQPLLNAGATRVDGFALARELLDSQDAQRR